MHLKQTIASMAHAAEAYPDPWGLPSMHLKGRYTVPGILQNFNTEKGFTDLNKVLALQQVCFTSGSFLYGQSLDAEAVLCLLTCVDDAEIMILACRQESKCGRIFYLVRLKITLIASASSCCCLMQISKSSCIGHGELG